MGGNAASVRSNAQLRGRGRTRDDGDEGLAGVEVGSGGGACEKAADPVSSSLAR